MNSKKQAKKNYEKKRDKLSKKSKKFEVDYNNKSANNDNFDIIETEDQNAPNETLNSNIVNEGYSNKVGKYWEKKDIISPVYTKGQVEIMNPNVILSNTGSTVKFLDGNTFESLSNSNTTKDNKETENTIVDFNHEDEEIVAFLHISRKNHLICCMENSLLRVFDLSANTDNKNTNNKKVDSKLVKTIKLNKTLCKKMVTDSTQRFIACMMTDKTISIIDVENYTVVNNFIGHKLFINDIVFNPIKKSFLVYSGSEDGEIKVWDILLGK